MYNYIWLIFLLLVLVISDVLPFKKKKASNSFRRKTSKKFCDDCKVLRKVSNQTVELGNRVTLKCSFQGIKYANITWYWNKKRLKKQKNIAISKFDSHIGFHIGSKLRIKEMKKNNVGLYTCVGVDPNDKYALSSGYIKIKQVYPTTTKLNGKCETYRKSICSPYIKSNTIFVENDPMKSQDFIEMKLKFGFEKMKANMSELCQSVALPLWCNYHFPACIIADSKTQPKSICRSDCQTIQNRYCKGEYDQRKSSEDDLFPDCDLLPNDFEHRSQKNCISIKQHMVISPTKTSGQCTVYNGNVCPTMKGKEVFVMSGVTNVVVGVIENEIEKISKTLKVSQQCSRYIRPLLCHLRLPECDKTASTPKAKPICRDECLSLKNDFCQKEYAEVGQSTTDIFFDCFTVPKLTVASGKCSSIGITQYPDMHTRVPKIGRCQPYTQEICKEYLDKKNIFVETGQIESNIEKKLEIAHANMKKLQISSKCLPFVLPVMCYHLFPFCEANSNNQPKPQRICRQDCKRVQYEFCPREHQIAKDQKLMTGPMLFPNCNTLSNMKCTSLRKLFFANATEPAIHGDCYLNKGENYKGFANMTESGAPCKRRKNTQTLQSSNYCRNLDSKMERPWCYTQDGDIQFCNIPKCELKNTLQNVSGEGYLGVRNTSRSGKKCLSWNKHAPELKLGHNYCRNPLGHYHREKPWCFVNDLDKNDWEYCNIPLQKHTKQDDGGSVGGLSNLLYTVVPCAVFGIIVAIVFIAVCWRKHKQGPYTMNKDAFLTVPVFLPELRNIPGENILLSKFIGNGKFGSIYAGEICCEDSSRISRLVKVALNDCREEFMNQAQIWSQFHHPNLLTIDAITPGTEPVTLVYESAAHGNLYQYLIHHSPNNPNLTQDHVLLDEVMLLDISRQIAAGMAYLSSHDYVHGDLMARNCQVGHCNVIKITDFTIDRDVCYYRRPNQRALALAWMSPECVESENYTIYSDVWAFGVLLWEIFTYGFQPYFGFSFAEVKAKILNMVLLEQPRDCIPEVYDLMMSCWIRKPKMRPHFVHLHKELNVLCNELNEVDSCFDDTTIDT